MHDAQSSDVIEAMVIGEEREVVLEAEGGDPEVV